MKKILVLALIGLSGMAVAQRNTCQVDMVDNYNRVIRTFTAYGDPSSCLEGMKECRKSIRLDYSRNPQYPNGSLDCVRADGRYNPTPVPTPIPSPLVDARRNINDRESVVYNGRFYTIEDRSYNGNYSIRSTDGWTIQHNIRREDLSITDGCSFDICTSDRVIDLTFIQYLDVVAISYDEKFVTKSKDNWNTVKYIDRKNIAKTEGCTTSRYAQICVGNTVIDKFNRYKTVVGIQLDGRVVVKSNDGWSNMLTTDVDPSNLVVTR